MKIILQRVSSSSVEVDGQTVGKINHGLMLLVGFGQGDTAEKLSPMAEKISNLRVFPEEKGKFHFSVKDVAGGVLLIPQFTLFGDTSKGRRPEFFGALAPQEATKLFDQFFDCFKNLGLTEVERGIFGAHMKVSLTNDGPVTLILES